MPNVPPLILYAVPVFFLLIFIEIGVSRLMRRSDYRLNDTVNDLSMGTVDQIGSIFLKTLVFAGYIYIYDNFRIFENISYGSAVAWIACFLLYDMMYYWAHRASHEVNIFWASHIPHHQSEEYNLSVALRQGVFQGMLFWIFYLPLAWLGFPPFVFLVTSQINTIYQFFIHTRTVGKLGPIEWFMNTPSHHRVHHGKNPKYIDKNHAGILIIWDRMFGTFQEEEEEPVYGTATPLLSWNPVWGQIHYWVDLAKLAIAAPRWQDKVLVWFMKPAWRPAGLEKEGPPACETAAFYRKYDPKVPATVSYYVLVQFVAAMIASFVYFAAADGMPILERVGVGALLLMTLVCFGGVLEAKRWAYLLDFVRLPVSAAVAVAYITRSPGLDSAAGALTASACILAALALMAWLARHRAVFANRFGRLELSPDNSSPVEQDRLPEDQLTAQSALDAG